MIDLKPGDTVKMKPATMRLTTNFKVYTFETEKGTYRIYVPSPLASQTAEWIFVREKQNRESWLAKENADLKKQLKELQDKFAAITNLIR